MNLLFQKQKIQNLNPFPDLLHFDNAGIVHGKRNIILLKPFLALTSYGNIEAHEGFILDGASIPKIAQSIVGHPFDVFLEDCVIHDWLYSPFNKLYTRKQADHILYETMWNRRNEISAFDREALHVAVRTFGWRFYRGYKPFKENENNIIFPN